MKIAAMAAGIVFIVTTPPRCYLSFASYGLIILCLLIVGRIPLSYAARRLLQVIPLVLVIAAFIPFIKRGEVAGSVSLGHWQLRVTYSGLLIFWNVLVKASLSALFMVLLTATTRFDRLLHGLESLRCPRILVMILSFMYRYVFLLSDEAMRMVRAKNARGAAGGWRGIKTTASIVGVLFIRAYERAERVYLAMCSRGFDGGVVVRRGVALTRGDILSLAVILICFGAARYAGGTL